MNALIAPAAHTLANAPRHLDPAATRSPTGELVVRRLRASDRPAVLDHLLALGPEDRASRFHALLGDEAIAGYVARLDFARMILVGAFEGENGHLVGLAEAHLDRPDAPSAAEVSVSVLADHRGHGVGRLLSAVALDAAGRRGARRAEFHFQAGNRALARLVRNLGTPSASAPGFAALALPLGAAPLH